MVVKMAKKEAKVSKDKKGEAKVKKHFFKDFKAELKKVIWPTPKQLVNNTTAVIVIVLITALLIALFDLVFREANTYGIYKLQSYVDEKFNTEEDTDNSTTDTEDSDDTTTEDSAEDSEDVTIEDSDTSETDVEVENNTEDAE
jgi:preprotein translocase subunit SecE